MTRNHPTRPVHSAIKGIAVVVPLLLALSCAGYKEGTEISQQGCLEQADQDYAECDDSCAEDETCSDECTDTWCSDVESCGIDGNPDTCAADTGA